jgi:hypothetical protein
MMSGTNSGTPAAQARMATDRSGAFRRRCYRALYLLLGRSAVNESVTTEVHFDAGPDAVWNRMMFYEEVPGQPPWTLRLFLPTPTRTEGDKRLAGGIVRCAYNAGDLFKRITAVDAPHLIQFEVIRQQLGIEDCIATLGGSYQIDRHGDGSRLMLTTNYQAYLRPRRLFRPLEKFLAGRLHRHILAGMNAALSEATAAARAEAAARLAPQVAHPGGLACTISQSHSRR